MCGSKYLPVSLFKSVLQKWIQIASLIPCSNRRSSWSKTSTSTWCPGQSRKLAIAFSIIVLCILKLIYILKCKTCIYFLNKIANLASLSKSAMSEQWDRIKVICCQPFNKEKPFGLAFIQFRSPEDLDSLSPTSTMSHKSSTRDNIKHDDAFSKLKQASGLNGCIRYFVLSMVPSNSLL